MFELVIIQNIQLKFKLSLKTQSWFFRSLINVSKRTAREIGLKIDRFLKILILSSRILVFYFFSNLCIRSALATLSLFYFLPGFDKNSSPLSENRKHWRRIVVMCDLHLNKSEQIRNFQTIPGQILRKFLLS